MEGCFPLLSCNLAAQFWYAYAEIVNFFMFSLLGDS